MHQGAGIYSKEKIMGRVQVLEYCLPLKACMVWTKCVIRWCATYYTTAWRKRVCFGPNNLVQSITAQLTRLSHCEMVSIGNWLLWWIYIYPEPSSACTAENAKLHTRDRSHSSIYIYVHVEQVAVTLKGQKARWPSQFDSERKMWAPTHPVQII